MKLNFYLLKSTVVAALGGLLFGFDTAVIAGTTHALTDTFKLSPAALGLTVSVALWGTFLGSMFAGKLCKLVAIVELKFQLVASAT